MLAVLASNLPVKLLDVVGLLSAAPRGCLSLLGPRRLGHGDPASVLQSCKVVVGLNGAASKLPVAFLVA